MTMLEKASPPEERRDVVLFVDDQPEILASLRRLLRDESYEVQTTTSPREALRRVARGDVSIVVTDERMPRVRGTDLLERVRRRSPGTSRVILTGFPGSYTLHYGLSQDVDWLLSKPWNDETLKHTIRHLLHRRSRPDAPAIGDEVPCPLVQIGGDGRVRWANPAFLDLLGVAREDVVDLPFAALHADVAAGARTQDRLAGAGGVRSLAARLRRKDGKEVDVLLDTDGPRDGHALVALRSAAESADELRLQAQVLHGQKLEAIGQLTAGIAHEINTPVGYILSNLSTMQDYVADLARLAKAGAEAEERLEAGEEPAKAVAGLAALRKEIDFGFLAEDFAAAARDSRQGAERIRDLVKGLRDYLRADGGEAGPADPNACFESALKLCWNELKYKVQIEREGAPLPPVACAPRRLEQVFVNLLLNAVQAIPRKGLIGLAGRVEGREAVLRLRDTGEGMTPEVLERAFEPFFTTKPVGTGTGLGLHVARRIVEGAGGRIEAASAPGKGSEFVIRLPLAEEKGSDS